jgi:hypothetical protein
MLPSWRPAFALFAFFLLFGFLSAGEEYQYSYLPKNVYENQIFPITVLEIGSSGKKPRFTFDRASINQPLSKAPLVVKNGNDSFYTFYFKADKGEFHLPALLIEDDNRSFYLDAAAIPILTLKGREDYCGVLAADMKIRTSQASTYDGDTNLVTLSIEAYEANLENMHLTSVIEDGVENIKRQGAKSLAEYYAVVPVSQKKIRFTYFNTIKKQFIYLEAPITIIDYTVSTQSELNPKDDSFTQLKKLTFVGVTLLFFLLFLWKHDFFYLLVAVIALITLVTFFIPKKEICVKQGASLYILPTYTSSISTKIESETVTPLLGQRGDYNKIEYKNGIIGWVKHEDLCTR